MSKRILAQSTTTFHTQVSTQVYSAPEVLGLDSNSETSNYTNSVDIWSLGCVIYELLVGTGLFVSEFQLSGYFYGRWPFPEDRLKSLSPPTDNLGISLLKSMLLIQPEDRPTAADALSHGWLAGFKTGNQDSRGESDEITKRRGERTPSRRREIGLATHDKQKKKGSGRNSIMQSGTRCIPVDVTLEANEGSRCGGGPTTPKAVADTCVTASSDAASVGNSEVQAGPLKSEAMLDPQTSHSKEPKARRKKKIRNIPQTHLQSSTPYTKPNLL